MSETHHFQPPPKQSWAIRALDFIEWLGNKLPDPAMLFLLALFLTWFLSAVLAPVEFADEDPRTIGREVEAAPPLLLKTAGRTEPFRLRREFLASLAVAPEGGLPGTVPWGPLLLSVQKSKPEKLRVKNQLTGEAMARFLSGMVRTFTAFPPLGLVLVALLGVGVAEHTGFINAGLKALLMLTPKRLLTPMLILVALLIHAAGDSGHVLVIPLGGVIFSVAGRHPLAGIAAGFAGVAGALSANFLPIALDPLLQGFTQEAAQVIAPGREVNPLCNWGFTSASSVLILILGWYLTDRVVEPRLKATPVDKDPSDEVRFEPLTSLEWRGLAAGLAVILVGLILLVLALLPVHSPMRSPKGELAAAGSPLMDAIIPLMFLFFLVPGIVYGYVARTVRSHRDVVKGMTNAMSRMGYYMVMAFFAAQFIYVFRESNVGALIAIKGAIFLQRLHLPPQATIVGIILLTAMVDLVISSASAKWALLGPIFVPMLMQLGLSPELTQAAYRIGDSCTNIISPLNPYFPLIVVFCQRYVKKAGVGTLVSMMLPYSVVFLVCWTLLLLGYWATGLPLGLQSTYTYP